MKKNWAQELADEPGFMKVEVFRAPGRKCQRCWKVLIEVGRLVLWPDLCYRCCKVLEATPDSPAYVRLQEQLADHPIRALALNPDVPRHVHSNGLVELWPRSAEEAPWLNEPEPRDESRAAA